MYRFTIILSLIIIASSFSSCEKTDPNELGRLQVTIYFDGKTVINAAVALATSQQNLKMGVYVTEIHTGLDGVANFGAIAPGTYYYDSYHYIDNNQTYLYADDVITVDPGHRHYAELELCID